MKDRAVVFAAILLLSLTGIASLHAEGPFHIEHEWKIGGDGGWDYLAVDLSRSCCISLAAITSLSSILRRANR
jgi:hypothetical protein